MIPNILYFTYKSDLLTDPVDTKDEALASNIRRIKNIVQNASIQFLTDTDCIHTIKKLPQQLQYNLLQVFKKEKRGMIRADICRGVALYQTGGWYLDVDVEITRDFRELATRMQSETLLTVFLVQPFETILYDRNKGYVSSQSGVNRLIRVVVRTVVIHIQIYSIRQGKNCHCSDALPHALVLLHTSS
tara:strand:+ start:5040 stop:5603 length:564 start_codon:yes stop_codon:yes gene_type:complete